VIFEDISLTAMARLYEKTKKGKFEAKKGNHDDILMSRMIALYVSSQLDEPKKINKKITGNQKLNNNSYATI
jgi:hypothetical protein